MAERIYGFVDGGYLCKVAAEADCEWPDPYQVVRKAVDSQDHQIKKDARIVRVVYYDAAFDQDERNAPKIRAYWSKIERMRDCHLGFGSLRGKSRREPRQKGVDTLLSVDMLVGAFTGTYDVAILVAGDGDFVPVVDEAKRRGVRVFLVAQERSAASDLVSAVDRFIPLPPSLQIQSYTHINLDTDDTAK